MPVGPVVGGRKREWHRNSRDANQQSCDFLRVGSDDLEQKYYLLSYSRSRLSLQQSQPQTQQPPAQQAQPQW